MAKSISSLFIGSGSLHTGVWEEPGALSYTIQENLITGRRGGGGGRCSVHTNFHHMTHVQEGLLQFEPIQKVLCFH